jgi:hypothetical protein
MNMEGVEWTPTVIALIALLGSIVAFLRKEKKEMVGDVKTQIKEIVGDVKTQIDAKVSADVCSNFRADNSATHTRMGREINDLNEAIVIGNKKFGKIEKCLVYLVEKQEQGAAAKMGLYD